MNILFAVPRFVENIDHYYELPLGIIYVATVLEKNRYTVSILDLNKFDSQKKALINFYKKNKVDIMCTGGLSAFFHSIEEIIKVTREYNSDITTILGGGIVTSDKEAISNEFNPDYIIIGEAEETIVELINALKHKKDTTKIQGIGYKEEKKYITHTVNDLTKKNTLTFKKDTSKWIFTEARESISNIDEIPYPNFNLIDLEDYFQRQTPIGSNYLYPLDFPRALPIITSRSCPLNCTFCFHPIGQKYRKKSMDKVFDEIEYMIKEYKINILVVMDEMMSANKNRLIEFSERIKKYNILWTCQLWTSSVDKKTLKFMKDSGCYLISYGLESINEDVLLSMQKFGINKKNIESTLKSTKEVGITIQGNFIFGDIAETVETSDETLQWWEKNIDYHISLGRVSPYPGTPLYKHALSKGLIKDRIEYTRRGTPSINLTNMTAIEYQELTSKIAMYSTKGRQFGEIQSIQKDLRLKKERYKFRVKCPHCQEIVEYGNIFIEKPSIFKLACRNCGSRFDINPSSFPNLKDKIQRQKEKLLKLKENFNSFIISPCVFENIFIEYFDLLELDYNDFDIKYVIDSNHTRVGTRFLNKFNIIQRNSDFKNEWKDSIIILMPSIYRHDIISEFENLGIPKKNIFSVELE